MDAGLIFILAFLVLLLFGLPIAVALGVVAIFSIWHAHLGIEVVSSNVYAGIAKFPLLAIPFSSWPASSWSAAGSRDAWCI